MGDQETVGATGRICRDEISFSYNRKVDHGAVACHKTGGSFVDQFKFLSLRREVGVPNSATII